jgi:hypothetical protein
LGGDGAAEAEGVGCLAHGGDTEGDVFFEGNAELLGAPANVFAGNAAGEGFVLEALEDGTDFEIEDGFGRPNVGAGGKKAGELVAGKKHVLERGLAGDASVVGVGKDGANHFIGIAALAKDFGAFGGVLAAGSVGVVGPALVIEIVEERCEAPEVLVGALLAGVGADAGFDGKGVFAEILRLRVFAEEVPSVVARGHGGLLKKDAEKS